MKKFSMIVAGMGLVLACGACSSTKSTTSAGMVAGEKACGDACKDACCKDAAKAKAAPGMVGEKKDGCGAASGCSASQSTCTQQKN
jgi:hypothetical protein